MASLALLAVQYCFIPFGFLVSLLGLQESLFIFERRYTKEANGVDSEVVTCLQSCGNFVILDQLSCNLDFVRVLSCLAHLVGSVLIEGTLFF